MDFLKGLGRKLLLVSVLLDLSLFCSFFVGIGLRLGDEGESVVSAVGGYLIAYAFTGLPYIMALSIILKIAVIVWYSRKGWAGNHKELAFTLGSFVYLVISGGFIYFIYFNVKVMSSLGPVFYTHLTLPTIA